MSEIHDRIKEVRTAESLTQWDFSLKISEKESRLKAVEYGKQRVPAEMLKTIVEIFHVDGNWLLTGEGQMYRSDHQKNDQATRHQPQTTLIENQRKARMTAFLDHWFESESPDEHAWLEGQLKRCIPEYSDFITDSKDDSKSQKKQG